MARLKVYAGTNEEYRTIITSEANQSLKQWMDSRAQADEKIGGMSWFMRDLCLEKESEKKAGVKKGWLAVERPCRSSEEA